ncbi:Hypothetical protein NocV09_04700210 [Nannochloropsis oceanica]
MQATDTDEDVAITVDYNRSHSYDIGGPAPICWKVVNGVMSRAPACPAELILTFSDPPPNPLFSMRDYMSHFRATINGQALGLVSLTSATTGLAHEIYHANVHSCVATVGFCSPFISNTPGLSTHSPEKRLNLTPIPSKPGWSTALIPNVVRLDPGTYTIIAHIWLETRKNNDVIKWSVAQAVTREVLPPKHFLTIAPAITYAMGAIVALTLAFLLFNVAALLYYRKHKIIRFSQGDILQVYGALILILGCYVAQKSAALTTLFNEGTYILFAIYTCSILAVIIVPATFAVASSPQTAYILRVLGVCLAAAGTIGAINLPKLLLIRSGVEMSLQENKTTAGGKTMAGSAKTSGNVSGGKDSGSTPTIILVKSHIPTSVFSKMQDTFVAMKKVKDRQEQGYALVSSEWSECVDEVKGLTDILGRCAVENGGGAAGTGKEGKGSARVAPSS